MWRASGVCWVHFVRVGLAGLNDIENERERAVVLDCLHCFCVPCISRWAKLRRECPLCKVRRPPPTPYHEFPAAEAFSQSPCLRCMTAQRNTRASTGLLPGVHPRHQNTLRLHGDTAQPAARCQQGGGRGPCHGAAAGRAAAVRELAVLPRFVVSFPAPGGAAAAAG